MLSEDQTQERVRVCSDFVAAVNRRGKDMLHKIITMDETMVSYYTPETKKSSKQWIKKGSNSLKKTWEGVTGPIAAEDYATAFRRWYERCERCVHIGVEKS
jgi:formamidopyrimidine-DNA glycosylase